MRRLWDLLTDLARIAPAWQLGNNCGVKIANRQMYRDLASRLWMLHQREVFDRRRTKNIRAWVTRSGGTTAVGM